MTQGCQSDEKRIKTEPGLRPEVRAKVLESLDVDPLAYVKELGKACKGGEFPRNVRPSLIQREQKRGRLLRSSLLLSSPAVQEAEVRD